LQIPAGSVIKFQVGYPTRSGTSMGAPRGAVVPDGGERPSISSPS
jgi:hypothetical protein